MIYYPSVERFRPLLLMLTSLLCSVYILLLGRALGGAPIGYFNWSMLNQAIVQGIESAVLFGGAYLALDYAFSKGWISKFE